MPYKILELPKTNLPELDIKGESYQEPTTLDTIGRNLNRSIGEIGSGVYGTPGNLESLARTLTNLGSRAVGQGEVVSPETALPTSQKLRQQFGQKLEPLYGEGYTEPQGAGEELLSAGVQEVGESLLPSLAGGGGIAKVASRVLTPLVGSTLGDITARTFTDNKDVQGFLRGVGSLAAPVARIGYGFVSNNALKDQGAQLLERAATTAPTKAQRAPKLLKELQKIEKEAEGIYRSPGRKEAMEIVNDTLGQFFGDKISPRKLVEMSKDINREYGKRSQTAQQTIGKIQGAIKDYLGTRKGSYVKPFLEGKQLYSAAHDAAKVQDVIKNVPLLKYLAKYPVYKWMTGQDVTLGKFAKVVARVTGLVKGANILKNVYQFPATRKYYGNVVKAALDNNIGSLTKNMIKLNKAYNKKYLPKPGQWKVLELPENNQQIESNTA